MIGWLKSVPAKSTLLLFKCICQRLVWISNPYSWQIVEFASNYVVRWCVNTCRPWEGKMELLRQKDAWRRRVGSLEKVLRLVQLRVSGKHYSVLENIAFMLARKLQKWYYAINTWDTFRFEFVTSRNSSGRAVLFRSLCFNLSVPYLIEVKKFRVLKMFLKL